MLIGLWMHAQTYKEVQAMEDDWKTLCKCLHEYQI